MLLSVAGAQAEDGADPRFADKIFTGGVIMTLNEAQPMAEAFVVLDNGMIAMGSHDEVIMLKGDRTEVVDLGGKTFCRASSLRLSRLREMSSGPMRCRCIRRRRENS